MVVDEKLQWYCNRKRGEPRAAHKQRNFADINADKSWKPKTCFGFSVNAVDQVAAPAESEVENIQTEKKNIIINKISETRQN